MLFALHAGDGALALELVAEQLEAGRNAGHHVVLDGGAGGGAFVGLAAAVEQQHADARVGRAFGDDGVGAEVGVGVVG
ncbi:hypothetical protein D9M71_685680 [compost metagenome]